jgi:hypothetical protein
MRAPEFLRSHCDSVRAKIPLLPYIVRSLLRTLLKEGGLRNRTRRHSDKASVSEISVGWKVSVESRAPTTNQNREVGSFRLPCHINVLLGLPKGIRTPVAGVNSGVNNPCATSIFLDMAEFLGLRNLRREPCGPFLRSRDNFAAKRRPTELPEIDRSYASYHARIRLGLVALAFPLPRYCQAVFA